VQYHRGKVFFGLLPYYPLNEFPNHKREYAAHIDLQQSQFFRYPLYHPEFYYAESSYTKNYDLAQNLVAGENLVLSFNGVPEFYVYNLNSGEIAEYHSKSKYLNLQEPPMKIKGKDDAEVKMETGAYGRIIHDPYRKLYYRVVNAPTPVFDEETGMYRTQAEVKNSILILNENFEQIGESLLFEGLKDNSMVVSKEGLLILDLKATEESNKNVIFAVINLSTHKGPLENSSE